MKILHLDFSREKLVLWSNKYLYCYFQKHFVNHNLWLKRLGNKNMKIMKSCNILFVVQIHYYYYSKLHFNILRFYSWNAISFLWKKNNSLGRLCIKKPSLKNEIRCYKIVCYLSVSFHFGCLTASDSHKKKNEWNKHVQNSSIQSIWIDYSQCFKHDF